MNNETHHLEEIYIDIYFAAWPHSEEAVQNFLRNPGPTVHDPKRKCLRIAYMQYLVFSDLLIT